MNASEINVNDWFFLDGEAQQVMPTVIDYVWNDFFPPLNIEPIEIDEELLLANGFEKRSSRMSSHLVLYHDDSPIYAELRPTGYWEIESYQDGIIEMSIRYVHELQHIFRLQGCIDLADNFKLKAQ